MNTAVLFSFKILHTAEPLGKAVNVTVRKPM